MSYDETNLDENEDIESELQGWDDYELEDEPQEGECDLCTGSTPEDLAQAAAGALIPVCACAIGQGAPPEECRCGPSEEG